MLRSALALIAGFAIMTFSELIALIIVATIMPVTPGNPSPEFQMVRLAYTTAAALFGGYSTASLARERKAGHAMVLALMIIVMHSYNIMNPQQGFPRSHFVWLLVFQAAAAIAGGKLRELQVRKRVKAA